MYTLGRFTTTPLGYSLVHLLEYSLAPRGLQGVLRFSGVWVYTIYWGWGVPRVPLGFSWVCIWFFIYGKTKTPLNFPMLKLINTLGGNR